MPGPRSEKPLYFGHFLLSASHPRPKRTLMAPESHHMATQGNMTRTTVFFTIFSARGSHLQICRTILSHFKSLKKQKNGFVVTRATSTRLHESGLASKTPPRSPIDLYLDKLAHSFGFCLIQARSGAWAKVGKTVIFRSFPFVGLPPSAKTNPDGPGESSYGHPG